MTEFIFYLVCIFNATNALQFSHTGVYVVVLFTAFFSVVCTFYLWAGPDPGFPVGGAWTHFGGVLASDVGTFQ